MPHMREPFDICLDAFGDGWIVYDAVRWRSRMEMVILERGLPHDKAAHMADWLNGVGAKPPANDAGVAKLGPAHKRS